MRIRRGGTGVGGDRRAKRKGESGSATSVGPCSRTPGIRSAVQQHFATLEHARLRWARAQLILGPRLRRSESLPHVRLRTWRDYEEIFGARRLELLVKACSAEDRSLWSGRS